MVVRPDGKNVISVFSRNCTCGDFVIGEEPCEVCLRYEDRVQVKLKKKLDREKSRLDK